MIAGVATLTRVGLVTMSAVVIARTSTRSERSRFAGLVERTNAAPIEAGASSVALVSATVLSVAAAIARAATSACALRASRVVAISAIRAICSSDASPDLAIAARSRASACSFWMSMGTTFPYLVVGFGFFAAGVRTVLGGCVPITSYCCRVRSFCTRVLRRCSIVSLLACTPAMASLTSFT